VVAEHDGDGRF